MLIAESLLRCPTTATLAITFVLRLFVRDPHK